ncbi:hypothetical protein AWV80_35295 [Cupriavidus sp. UYMU48A]|nr:hypothetical protein AWV80_35295 [Cupriavidus sp. UYMU48A]
MTCTITSSLLQFLERGSLHGKLLFVAFFERVSATLVRKASPFQFPGQRFKAAGQRHAIGGLDALRNLSERHGLRSRRGYSRGNHVFAERMGAASLMTIEQAAQPFLAPGVRPVVHSLLAHIQLRRDLVHSLTCTEQQQALSSNPEVFIRMPQRKLFQGSFLHVVQFDGALHRRCQLVLHVTGI